MSGASYRTVDGNGKDQDSTWPAVLITGTGVNPKPRLRVDVAQTSFFENREARTLYEFSIPVLGVLYLQVQVLVNTVLSSVGLEIDDGWIRMTTLAGGTPSGVFTSCSVYRKNNMTDSPVYTPVNTIAQGGTQTGGVVLDIIRAQSGSKAPSVGVSVGDERGIPPGTYYYKLECLGTKTSTGVFRLGWEERP